MAPFDRSTSPAVKRNPKILTAQAILCDNKRHVWTFSEIKGKKIMHCAFCGERKGGLPPVKIIGSGHASGKSAASGSLTAKK